jgi:hypothetical protein
MDDSVLPFPSKHLHKTALRFDAELNNFSAIQRDFELKEQSHTSRSRCLTFVARQLRDRRWGLKMSIK